MTDVLVIGGRADRRAGRSPCCGSRRANRAGDAAIVIAGGMRVDDLARIPLSTRAFWLASPSRQHTNLASRSAGKHARRHKRFGEC